MIGGLAETFQCFLRAGPWSVALVSALVLIPDLAVSQERVGSLSCAQAIEMAAERVKAATEAISRLPQCPVDKAGQDAEGSDALIALQDRLVAYFEERIRAAATGGCSELEIRRPAPLKVVIEAKVRDPSAIESLLNDPLVKARLIDVAMNVARIDVCGTAIGDGYMLQINESGQPGRVLRNEISSMIARLPLANECASIGALVDGGKTGRRDPGGRDGFWVRRDAKASSPIHFCRRKSTGEWEVTPVVPEGTRALVVFR